MVDRNALRFNQASIIALAVAGFVLGEPVGVWLVGFVAAVMLLGTLYAPASGFKLLYRHLFVRLGWLKPKMEHDDPAPHQFAQGMGGTVLAVAFVALLAGASTLGWILAWLVVALAAVNLLAGFCLGCFIYFQLEHRGLLRGSAR